jgi:hypothetical protein
VTGGVITHKRLTTKYTVNKKVIKIGEKIMRNTLLTAAIAMMFATAPVLAEETGAKSYPMVHNVQGEKPDTNLSTQAVTPVILADEQLDTVAAGVVQFNIADDINNQSNQNICLGSYC